MTLREDIFKIEIFRSSILHVTVLLLLSLHLPVISQQEARFSNLNQSNGLKSSDVMCFQQDKYGFIWIGTKYGLNVFDGANFNVFGFENSVPFVSDISALQLGQDEEMWVGTTGDGLFMYNMTERTLQRFSLSFESDSASTITCLEYWNNSLWIGTEQGLFLVSEEESVSRVFPLQGSEYISDIIIHGKELVLSTQESGVFVLDSLLKVKELPFSSGQINAVLSLVDGRLLVGTQYAGLHCLSVNGDSENVQCFNKLFFGSPPVINELLCDHAGSIWVGTDGEGLFQFTSLDPEETEVKNYRFNSKKPNSIASNAIFSLFEDRGENLWIGTIWQGLSILDLNASSSELLYSDISGDDAYPVLSIFSEEDNLWIGTDGEGLNLIQNATYVKSNYSTTSHPALSGDYIQRIYLDSKGLYWIGTFSSGLNCLDMKRNRVETYKSIPEDTSSISYNDVRMILEDDQSNLWIATWGGGLNHFNRASKHFTHYYHGNGFDDPQVTNDITSICWDVHRKGIWVGSFGHGLLYFDLESKLFRKIHLPGSDRLRILTIKLDQEGYLWIGTWGNGLIAYDTRANECLFEGALKRLETGRITSIEEDNQGRKWLSSKNGIYRFDSMDSSLVTVGIADLLSNREFHINASCKDKYGNIYFGGLEGVIKIIPERVVTDEYIFPPVITNVFLFNEDLPTYNALEDSGEEPQLRLAYNQNFITFSFSSPKFPVSDVLYSYRLMNYSDEWLSVKGDRATYTNLPPGKYIFSVRSSLNNLEWSEATQLKIIISSPYWKTWYAYLIYIIVFILLLYLFQKYTRDLESVKSNLKLESLKREKEQELSMIKHRFFTNISHEIRTPVTLMLGATNSLLESSAVSREKQDEVTVLQNSSRHLLNLINELLDFRRLESEGIKLRVAEGDIQKFAREIYLSFVSQAYSKNIDYRFVSREEEMKLWFDRDQMEKVLYNLISNAFKYTPSGGIVTLELDQDDQYCYLKVIDSGIGVEDGKIQQIFERFYQSENSTGVREQGFGLGLSISRDIIKMHGGEIYARNNEDAGISISAKLPKGDAHIPTELQIKDFRSSEFVDQYKSDKLTLSTSLEDFDLKGQLLLIVEDNSQLREYLSGLFAGKMTVITAADGEEGLKMAEEEMPDIIVSDVMMPVMDGVTMTKKLKMQVATSHIPVILLTARTNLIYKKEGYDIGADDYITKPFNEVLLKTRVMNILRNRVNLREKLLNDYLSSPREELNLSTPDQQFLANLTGVIDNNLEEKDISAALISSELGMSHSVIYKKIKALTGMSLVEFVRDFKLKRASVLLSKYQMNISEVCYKVGFSDRRYFSKLFKNKFGVTPSEFSRRND